MKCIKTSGVLKPIQNMDYCILGAFIKKKEELGFFSVDHVNMPFCLYSSCTFSARFLCAT